MAKVKVAPGVLSWARESLGFTLEEASVKTKIAEDKLVLIEGGKADVSLSQLKNFSNIYKRPLATFFLPQAPSSELVTPDFRTLDSVEKGHLSKEARLAIRKANRNRKILVEISEGLDERLPQFNFKFSINDSPEEVAQQIRRKIKVKVEDQSDWKDKSVALKHWIYSIENLGVIVSQISIPVEEMRGFCLKGNDLPPAIVINRKDDENGRIFTLWHEFGHLLYDDQNNLSHTKIEKLANHFAGAFLVPINELNAEGNLGKFLETKGDYYLARLAGRFKVSKEVILRRLLILEYISKKYYEEKREELLKHYADLEKRRKAKEKEQEKSGFSQPGKDAFQAVGHNLSRKLFDAQSKGVITQSDVAGVFEVKTKHFGKIKESIDRYDF